MSDIETKTPAGQALSSSADADYEASLSRLDLTKKISVLIEKGDRAAKKAEEFYIAAGQYIKEVKHRWADNWLEIIERDCGLGRSRAYEVLAIADGRTTVEKVRADNAESKRLSREKARQASPGQSRTRPWRTDEQRQNEIIAMRSEVAAHKKSAPTANPEVSAAAMKAKHAAAAARANEDEDEDEDDTVNAASVASTTILGVLSTVAFWVEGVSDTAVTAAIAAQLDAPSKDKQAAIATLTRLARIIAPLVTTSPDTPTDPGPKPDGETDAELASEEQAPAGTVLVEEDALLKKLASAKRVRSAALRAQRKIYSGLEPCSERDRNPAFDAAVAATDKATADYNAIVDQINPLRSDAPQPVPLTPPAPSPSSPAPAPTPTPPAPSQPKPQLTWKYQPGTEDDPSWKQLSADDLTARIGSVLNYIRRQPRARDNNERLHRYMEEMEDRLAVLCKADRAERSPMQPAAGAVA
jgi:hypothetical protein